jgi:adenine-specific DNA-methyltransferase
MSKIIQAIEIIKLLGFPIEQQNERSALTLLSLLDISEEKKWNESKRPMLGVTPMMNWLHANYDKRYAPNTRETIRRQTLHQFVEGGLCLYNPDKPDRPVNSPKACYQIAYEAFKLIKTYDSNEWSLNLQNWLSNKTTLVKQYSQDRIQELIPLTIRSGEAIYLSPGDHSELIKDIVEKFAPRFAGGSEVVYLGDTGAKSDYFNQDLLSSLGVSVDRKGKLPDVVLYLKEKNWLILVESVTSHGPVDGKRYIELNNLFSHCIADLVFVTAFPDKKTMNKFLTQISWETEVWISDNPSHMIHFNGDKFLGPYRTKNS